MEGVSYFTDKIPHSSDFNVPILTQFIQTREHCIMYISRAV